MTLSDFVDAAKTAVGLKSRSKAQKPDFTIGHLIRCGDYRFLVDPRDKFVGDQLRSTGKYESDELEQISERLTPTSHVLFVGAHIGALAIPASKFCEKIFVIEANPDTFEMLKINFYLNGIENGVLINSAAGECSGTIRFVKNTANSGGSKREPKIKEEMYYYDNPDVVDVDLCRIDDVISSDKIDLIVMDIEGSEYYALLGMPRILENTKSLIIEFVPHHLDNVSCVTVDEFLSPILPHFNKLTVPSLNFKTVYGEEITALIKQMHKDGATDGGIIFERV